MNGNTSACIDVRAGMLEADAADLRGEGNSAVALHIRGCAACAADAHRILAAQQRLSDAIDTLTAPGIPTAAAGTSQVAASTAGMPRGRTRRFPRGLIAAAAPFAAAAVLVLLLVRDRGADAPVRLEPSAVPVATNTTVVNVAPGRDVAVMQTSNPNITVVWYLNREIQ